MKKSTKLVYSKLGSNMNKSPYRPNYMQNWSRSLHNIPYSETCCAQKTPFYRSISTIAAACLVAFLTILNAESFHRTGSRAYSAAGHHHPRLYRTNLVQSNRQQHHLCRPARQWTAAAHCPNPSTPRLSNS